MRAALRFFLLFAAAAAAVSASAFSASFPSSARAPPCDENCLAADDIYCLILTGIGWISSWGLASRASSATPSFNNFAGTNNIASTSLSKSRAARPDLCAKAPKDGAWSRVRAFAPCRSWHGRIRWPSYHPDRCGPRLKAVAGVLGFDPLIEIDKGNGDVSGGSRVLGDKETKVGFCLIGMYNLPDRECYIRTRVRERDRHSIFADLEFRANFIQDMFRKCRRRDDEYHGRRNASTKYA
ncbi:hypothetical protein B0H13DRAFT_1922227 [Mycena leptocephala]|nr:hypothetical protein B0H13DRAFT_1922227 [Mycena leptocephala]